MYGYIYKTTNLINNKIYIGQKKSDRFLKEKYLGSGNYIKAAINKYGKDNFSVELLDVALTKDELNSKEIFYIDKYNSTDMNIGYNIHKGGRGGILTGDAKSWSEARKGANNGRYGVEVSEETRRKIGEANSKISRTEETKKRISESLKGRAKPNGFGKKVSAAQKGRVKSELELEHLKLGNLKAAEKNRGKHIYNNGEREIRLHDVDAIPYGFVRGRLPKMSELASLHDHSGVNNGMYGKKHSEESILKMRESKRGKHCGENNPHAKPVMCIETGKIYGCIADACADTGLTTIGACCKGIISECKKNHTHWVFVDEDKSNK